MGLLEQEAPEARINTRLASAQSRKTGRDRSTGDRTALHRDSPTVMRRA
jgi:hypothetical protein